ncbi:conserved exported hypothetical protein [Planktothrix serta PCC 8927]|uniref:DUF1574 domain-containing protein n=1 Tax=Planktothrix serta PCC 8927 TaxID=671068 RepID=A0A7Z9BJ69_9CYAN|nr:DUF1574 family protein [Planktothrix serta]VXD12870.1 conserved exported hypothetical protein [Planktothrix serta PCC 8927]
MSLLSIFNLLIRSQAKNSLVIATLPLIILTVGCSSLTQSSQPSTSSRNAIAASLTPTPKQLDKNKILVGQGTLPPQNLAKSQTCIQENPFDESVKFALQASNLAQTARSKEQWDEVARLWLQAVAWMQAVPANSPKRVFAEKKVIEYMRYLAYSQQQAARSGSISQFPSFESQTLDQQLQLYLSYLSTVGKPDILIVGSSRALQGVDPAQMQQALAKKGYQNLRIFNFGVNGATAQVVDYILRKVLTPEQLPKLIIWADGVRAFNSGRIDRTHEAIMASQAHQKIAAGIRPQLAKTEPNFQTKCYQLPQPCKPKDNSKFQFEISNFIKNNPSNFTRLSANNADSNYQNLFYRPSEFNRAATLVSLDAIEANGFLPLSIRFNPNTYYQQKPYVSGSYDGDYRAFNLGGKQATAFDSVVAFVRSNQIQLVFVNLPLTDDYLDGVRWSAEVEFQEQMQQLSQEYGFIFIDLSEKALTQYNYFADPSHLNRYGASIVAQTIVANPSIPWPRVR